MKLIETIKKVIGRRNENKPPVYTLCSYYREYLEVYPKITVGYIENDMDSMQIADNKKIIIPNGKLAIVCKKLTD